MGDWNLHISSSCWKVGGKKGKFGEVAPSLPGWILSPVKRAGNCRLLESRHILGKCLKSCSALFFISSNSCRQGVHEYVRQIFICWQEWWRISNCFMLCFKIYLKDKKNMLLPFRLETLFQAKMCAMKRRRQLRKYYWSFSRSLHIEWIFKQTNKYLNARRKHNFNK